MASAFVERRYHAAGLAFDSEIPFPQLEPEPDPAASPPDFLFRIGALPPQGTGLELRLNSFGCVARDGRRVTVSVSENAVPDKVSRTVLTAGLNAIAYQRGLLPLHSSAVAVGEHCMAFCGDSGAGKSTLAAALAQLGYPLVSDDLLIVHPGEDAPLVWPAITRPKLTRQSIDLLEGKVKLLSDIASWDGKAIAAVGGQGDYVPRPLAAIYLLGWGPPAERQLTPLEASAVLSRYLRKPDWVEPSGRARAIRRQCLELAARVSVMRITRPRDAQAFADLPLKLDAHWRRQGPGDRINPIFATSMENS